MHGRTKKSASKISGLSDCLIVCLIVNDLIVQVYQKNVVDIPSYVMECLKIKLKRSCRRRWTQVDANVRLLPK